MSMNEVSLAVQCAVLLILAIHDWIPLGRLNDLDGFGIHSSVFRSAPTLGCAHSN
jgi:hypothetical protein